MMYPYAIEWFNWIAQLPAGMEFVILLAAAVAGLFALHKKVFAPLMRATKRWNAAVDSLVGGHDAIVDPDNPNVVLKDATAPLSQRVAMLEDAVNRLVDMQEKQLGINERVLALEEWRNNHETWSEEIIQKLSEETHAWQKEHESMHALAGTITHDLQNGT